MRPIILIPSRLNSTRLPNKPLALISGVPMIVHVWRRAMEAKIAEVAVACDNEAIEREITQAGGKAIMTDPNLPSGSDRIFAALKELDPRKQFDVVVNVQGDMPTLDPALISKSIAMLDNKTVDIATLAAPIRNKQERTDPAVVKVVLSRIQDAGFRIQGKEKNLASPESRIPNPESYRALYFSRATVPYGDGPLYHHVGLYAYRRESLEKFVGLPPSPLELREKLEQLRALEAGMHIEVGIVEEAPLGVDTPVTLERARAMMRWSQSA